MLILRGRKAKHKLFISRLLLEPTASKGVVLIENLSVAFPVRSPPCAVCSLNPLLMKSIRLARRAFNFTATKAALASHYHMNIQIITQLSQQPSLLFYFIFLLGSCIDTRRSPDSWIRRPAISPGFQNHTSSTANVPIHSGPLSKQRTKIFRSRRGCRQ